MALFISFEGGEGSGKSTQAKFLTERLASVGFDVCFVHEPGSTELGGYVREWLKRGLPGGDAVSDNAELLLFSAARAELVCKTLKPHLALPNGVVVADRYVDSTTAYQGGGRGIARNHIDVVNALATQGVMPNLTFLLDIDPRDGLDRMGSLQYGLPLADAPSGGGGGKAERHMEGGRFEDEPMGFHNRVRRCYLALAAAEPHRWRILDAALPRERLSALIWDAVCAQFPHAAAQVQQAHD